VLGRLPSPRDVLASPLLLPAAAALLDGPPPAPPLACPLPFCCLFFCCAPPARTNHVLSGSAPSQESRSGTSLLASQRRSSKFGISERRRPPQIRPLQPGAPHSSFGSYLEMTQRVSLLKPACCTSRT
jgi:hypothetical protein